MSRSLEGQPRRLRDGFQLLQDSGQLTHGIVSHTLLRHWTALCAEMPETACAHAEPRARWTSPTAWYCRVANAAHIMRTGIRAHHGAINEQLKLTQPLTAKTVSLNPVSCVVCCVLCFVCCVVLCVFCCVLVAAAAVVRVIFPSFFVDVLVYVASSS